MISQDEYLAYLKGIATKIDASGIAERYRPVARLREDLGMECLEEVVS